MTGSVRIDSASIIGRCILTIFSWLVLLPDVRSSDGQIPPRHPETQPTRPNILFIFTDDQRYNTIRALGGKEVFTPHLDSLVAAGTTFTHAFNMGAWHGAVCVASRTMLLTGRSVWHAQRAEKELDEIVAASGLWSQHLRKAGYVTYMTGKWHIRTDVTAVFDHVTHERPGMPNQTPQGYHRPQSPRDTAWTPWNRKFEGFWKGGKHWSEALADDAMQYLEQARGSKNPFFMYLAFNAPHDPRQAPKEFAEKYPVDEIDIPGSYLPEYPYKEEMGAGKKLRDEQLAPFPRTPYAVKKHIQEYYASISHLDAQVGRILNALRKTGKINNTFVFFTSDHGLAAGHHGLMGKQSMFDHSVRVPLVVAGPGIPQKEKRDQLVYLQDIMATTYDLAGIEKPDDVFFTSLLPLIRDQTSGSAYKEIYGGYMNLQRMVRTERYKLIVYPQAEKVLLFDLASDPEEMHDVSGNPRYRPAVDDMYDRLLRQQQQLNDPLDLTGILEKARVDGTTARANNQAVMADSLPSDDFIHAYGDLGHFFFRVQQKKEASVAFLGGSITAGGGWRDKVMQYLASEYPDTHFTFLNAGIPSLGSVPHAFRFQTDVLTGGPVDLLFIESAVNDLANSTPVVYQRRALEGIVRQARKANPSMDIVLMAFVDEVKIGDYASGKTPAEVQVHDDIARHYGLPFLNLAAEVSARIDANEFTWEDDFKDLHPSPFGHQVYFRSIKRLFELSKGKPDVSEISAKLPVPLEGSCYDAGRYVAVSRAKKLRGFAVDPSWRPDDGAKSRKRFVNVPMLIAEKAGSFFEFSFRGNAAGMAIVAGPDAGIIQYSIDGGPEQTIDLFTQWSRSLHLPWYLMLGDGLESGKHTLKVTLTDDRNPESTGTACRIVQFLVNE